MERRPSREDLVGRQVGRYTVMSHLASGGMSELYIARQEAVGGFEKNLVIKVLQDRYAQHPRVVKMFLDEARLAAKLNHPSIVHVYDVAEEEGSRFIAMEYIHGETLTDTIKRAVEAQSFLPLEHALHIVTQVAAGLDYAHRRHEPGGALLRIVHRDVSPSNIMVSYEGQAKIIDFGIARVQDQIREESGMHPGKASYMSPEQVMGAAVDYRSDIFSLGIILFEITTAQRLWRGPAEEVKRRIVSDAIPLPTSLRSDYPPGLEPIVMRALKKRPEDRYQSAEELRHDLEELVASVGFRSGARRLALYLRELFPTRAALTDGGVVQPHPPGDSESVPLPVVGGGDGAVGNMASGMIVVPPAPPKTPLHSPVTLVPPGAGAHARGGTAPEMAVSRGPSNAKLALGAAAVTFTLVTIVVLLGRSHRPEIATAAQPARALSVDRRGEAIAHEPPPPRVEPPPPVAEPPQPTPPVLGVSTPPPAAPHAVRTPPPSRGPSYTSDRARNRRQRRQASPIESSSRAGAPLDSPPPAPSAPEPPRPSGGEPAPARPAVRPPGPPPSAPSAETPAPAAAPSPPPGFVDGRAVAAVVRAHAAEVQACFDRALMEHADLHGRLTVRATIDPKGHVIAAAPTTVLAGGGRLQTCVVSAFQSWTFPQPAGGVKGTIGYTFAFE